MEIVLIQYIESEDDKFPKPIYKALHSDIIPHKGDFISDTLWKEREYEIDHVTIDYTYKRCEVVLNKCEEVWNKFDDYLKLAETHGWSNRYPMKGIN